MSAATSKKNSTEKTYLCDEPGCHKSFYRSSHLSRHRLNHRPKQVFNCLQCEKRFVRLDLLQRHERRHERGMVIRRIGGVVHLENMSEDNDGQLNDESLSPERDEFTAGVAQMSPVSLQGHYPNSRNDIIDFLGSAQTPPMDSLFFDASAEMRDFPDHPDWLLNDLYLASNQDSAFSHIPGLANPYQTINLSPGVSATSPPTIAGSNLNSWTSASTPFADPGTDDSEFELDLWTSVRIRLLTVLSTLPSEILETSFFYPANLRLFYNIYFESYNSHFPILHEASLSPTKAPPLLIAALVVLGSTLAPDPNHFDIGISILNNLRWIAFSSGYFEPPAPLWFLQTLLIIQAHEKMYATRKNHEKAHIFHGAIITLMRRGRSYSSSEDDTDNSSDPLERSWYKWIKRESSHRTAFFAFIMDAQHSSIFGHTPILSVSDIQLPLPCSEALWNCRTATEWQRQFRKTPESPQFLITLKSLLRSVPVPSSCSAYGRLILLHGLFSVTTYLQARGKTTLGVETRHGVAREQTGSPPPSSVFDDWKEILDRSIDTWSFSLLSQSHALCLEAARPLHRIAHISVHADILDFHTVAGAPSLLGSSQSRNDYRKAERRVRAWVDTPDAKVAVFHSLLLIQETMFTGRRYLAKDDNIILRPWCLYHATLILWAYGTMIKDTQPPEESELSAEEYLVYMLSSLKSRSATISGASMMKGLVQMVGECLQDCRWELLQEARVILGRLVADNSGP